MDRQGIELAIDGRSADAQSSCGLGHLSAIVGDREPNRFRLDLLERAHVTACVEQRQRTEGRDGRRRGDRGASASPGTGAALSRNGVLARLRLMRARWPSSALAASALHNDTCSRSAPTGLTTKSVISPLLKR
jgi:hypothetical protein